MTRVRILELEGGTNFRDVGGYPTADGRRVRWGQVFRSGTLTRLTEGDVATLIALGIRAVFDLRTAEECERSPSRLPAGVRCQQFEIGGSAARTKQLTDLVLENRLDEVPDDFLVHIYENLVELGAPMFGQVLNELAEGATPAVIHCTAGKDRTGMAVALLLGVLGVDLDTILDDYELSAVHYTDRELERLAPRLAESGISPERYRLVFGAPRPAMAAALGSLGPIDAFVQEACGVRPEAIASLRQRLLEDADD